MSKTSPAVYLARHGTAWTITGQHAGLRGEADFANKILSAMGYQFGGRARSRPKTRGRLERNNS